MKNLITALSLIIILWSYVSCSTRITGQLLADGTATIQVQAGLEPNMISLANSLRSLSEGEEKYLLDANTINRSLRATPGVSNSVLRNTKQEYLQGPINVNRIGDLLNAGANRFITYTPASSAAPGKLSIYIDKNTAPHLLAQIAPEAVDYLSALLAPAATGEPLTRAQYLALVESIYGKALSVEIGASRFSAALTLPAPVKSVKGGTFSGREARFDLPLTDLLVLEKPLDIEITW